MDYRVTIIITSFNHKGLLKEAIDSVLCQSLPPFEIIVADDGSTDGSRELILEYERSHPDLIRGLLQKQNMGIPRNRNAALQMVRGNYVGILDGDDVFLPDKLQLQIKALNDNPRARAVYGNFNIVDEDRRFISKKWQGTQPEGHVLADVANIKTGLLRTLIFDYQLLREVGFLNEKLPRYDGLLFTIKLAAACQFAYVNEALVDKRDHSSSDSKGITAAEHLHDLELIYEEIEPLLRHTGDDQEYGKITASWRTRLGALRDRVSSDVTD